MSSIASISLSGMQAAQSQLNVAAGNIANSDTPGYQRRVATPSAQAGGGVAVSVGVTPQAGSNLTTDVVSELQAKNAFIANLSVFKTANAMSGTLLDTSA